MKNTVVILGICALVFGLLTIGVFVSQKKDLLRKDSVVIAKDEGTHLSNYVNYSPEAFDAAVDKRRVYFFHASWCPTCKEADAIFTQQHDQIPQDLVIFKTNYDTEQELKKKFNITYQHTFVYVNPSGEEIKKWNGGDFDDLFANTQ